MGHLKLSLVGICRTMLVVSAALVLVVSTTNVALANVPSGTATQTEGPGLSNGYQRWDGGPETMYVQAAASGTFSSGYCLDSWFDWNRTGGHFDARVARTCRTSIQSQGSSSDGNNNLNGMQKAATCYGPNQNTTAQSSYCTNDGRVEQSVVGNVRDDLANTCTRDWRIPSGSSQIIYDAGGSKTSCTS